MYSKVGKIIKKYTAVIVAIQITLVILAAIVIFIAGFQAEGVSAVLYILVAVLVGVLGSFAVWFTGAFIYAYGEIADKIVNIDKQLRFAVPVYIVDPETVCEDDCDDSGGSTAAGSLRSQPGRNRGGEHL